MDYNINYNIYKMKKEMRLVIRECLNQRNIDWDYHIDQWRNIISPLFSRCENIIEGIRVIDPIFREVQLDEERREMENRFYLILSNVCEVPSCVPKSELVDALILFYWCEATSLCYYSFNELVTNMTQKTKK